MSATSSPETASAAPPPPVAQPPTSIAPAPTGPLGSAAPNDALDPELEIDVDLDPAASDL